MNKASKSFEWLLNESDLEAIALGAGILGTGGGGNPYLAFLMAREELRAGRSIRVISADQLTEHDLVLPLGGIGAPTVSIEQMDNGDEGCNLVAAIEQFTGRKVTALIADEIGGGNGLSPMSTAARLGLPIIDADGMGRAFPETQMTSFFIYGQPTSPAAITDASGNTLIVTQASTPEQLERMMRAITVTMGCAAMMSTPPLNGDFVSQYAIPRSVTQAWELGHAVNNALNEKTDPIEAIVGETTGKLLMRGKVIDVAQQIEDGFVKGVLKIDGIDHDSGRTLSIDVQNEYLVACENGQKLIMVPDLICIVDLETGRSIGTEEQRYGLRVAIIAIPAPTLLTTAKGLESVGPRAFGYDFDFVSMSSITTNL